MSSVLALPRLVTGTIPRLAIDLEAVAANVRLLDRVATGELMAVVKADGFGHGALDVARTALANGASWLGVTSIEEALPLREAGLRAPLLSWLNPVDADFGAAISARVDLAVSSREHLEAICRAGGAARVHLHIDAGMARDGAPPALWGRLCRAARRAEQQGLVQVVGLMGHLPCADNPGDPSNAAGRTRFAWALEVARSVGLRPTHRHLAATAATLTDPRSHHTLVRVGAGLVGIDPSGTTALRAALTLTAPVIGVRRVRSGTPVGYGHTFVTPTATRLALLPVGYADGLPRAASNRAAVFLGGRRCPVVGRISMDQTVVEVGTCEVRPGDVATIFGAGLEGGPTAADWAAWADTIEHEIVTGIGSRVQRTVVASPLRGLS